MTKADTLLELARERMRDYWSAINLLTTQASITLGALGLVMVADVPNLPQGHPANVLPFLMYASAAVCAFATSLAFVLRNYPEGADLRRTSLNLKNYKHDEVKWWIAEQAIEACKQSSENLIRTAIAVSIGMRSLAVVLFLYISMKIIAYAYIT